MVSIKNFWRMPWSTLAGVILGGSVVLMMPAFIGPLRDAYDAYFPVVRMTGALHEKTDSYVVLHITGEKVRGEECRQLAVFGYSIDAAGRLHDAVAQRIDPVQAGRVRDKGYYDIGLWKVQPIYPNSVAVKVVVQHDCVGRVVLSTLAETALSK